MDRTRDALERALGYPYATPLRSFTLREGRALDPGAAAVDRGSRIALLAYGSNAAPAVLAAKLGPATDPVPVLLAELSGFDAVFSAHLAAYGSVPATLHPAAATTVTCCVAFVTAAQLALIARTEPNYELRTLRDLDCVVDGIGPVTEAATFLSRFGPLLVEGSPVALEAVAARRRSLPEMSQRQALERVRGILRPELDLGEFVLAWVSGEIPADLSGLPI